MSLIESPGPSAYSLPSSFGRGKAASIKGKISHRNPAAEIPGPGSYQVSDVTKGAPRYTMASRTKIPDPFVPSHSAATPGPIYDTLNHKAIGKSGPAPTLKGKIEYRDPHAAIPGPGNYERRSSIGEAPMISLKGKAAPEKVEERGAPVGSYDIPTTIGSGPSISMKGKHEIKDEHRYIPGPGEYNVDLAKVAPSAPKYSLSARIPEPPPKEVTPSPVDYHTESYRAFGKGGPMISLKSKIPERDYNSSPGPGVYEVGTSIGDAPAFSMSQRIQAKETPEEEIIPGPGSHYVENWKAVGTGAPMISLKGKLELKNPQAEIPGPGNYLAENGLRAILPNAPAYSLRARPKPEEPLERAPPVGAYNPNIPFGKDGPQISFKHKIPAKEWNIAPGVGSYTMPELGKGPAASLKPRLGSSLYASSTNPIRHIESGGLGPRSVPAFNPIR